MSTFPGRRRRQFIGQGESEPLVKGNGSGPGWAGAAFGIALVATVIGIIAIIVASTRTEIRGLKISKEADRFIRVGPTREFKTPSEALCYANERHTGRFTITLDEGTYVDNILLDEVSTPGSYPDQEAFGPTIRCATARIADAYVFSNGGLNAGQGQIRRPWSVETSISGVGPFEAIIAEYSPPVPVNTDFTGEGAIANPLEACDPIAAAAGKVVLVARGTCLFSQKTDNAEAAGSVATIIYNTNPEVLRIGGALGSSNPTVSISQVDGEALKAALEANPGMTLTVKSPSTIYEGGVGTPYARVTLTHPGAQLNQILVTMSTAPTGTLLDQVDFTFAGIEAGDRVQVVAKNTDSVFGFVGIFNGAFSEHVVTSVAGNLLILDTPVPYSVESDGIGASLVMLPRCHIRPASTTNSTVYISGNSLRLTSIHLEANPEGLFASQAQQLNVFNGQFIPQGVVLTNLGQASHSLYAYNSHIAGAFNAIERVGSITFTGGGASPRITQSTVSLRSFAILQSFLTFQLAGSTLHVDDLRMQYGDSLNGFAETCIFAIGSHITTVYMHSIGCFQNSISADEGTYVSIASGEITNGALGFVYEFSNTHAAFYVSRQSQLVLGGAHPLGYNLVLTVNAAGPAVVASRKSSVSVAPTATLSSFFAPSAYYLSGPQTTATGLVADDFIASANAGVVLDHAVPTLVLTDTSPQTVTIDLSATLDNPFDLGFAGEFLYVGREYKIINAEGQAHVIQLPPLGSGQVFLGNGVPVDTNQITLAASTYCLTLRVRSSSVVDVCDTTALLFATSTSAPTAAPLRREDGQAGQKSAHAPRTMPNIEGAKPIVDAMKVGPTRPLHGGQSA